jgi:hypothetical protein
MDPDPDSHQNVMDPQGTAYLSLNLPLIFFFLTKTAEKRVVETSDSPPSSSGLQTSGRAKVKENVKTASYGLVIAVGLGVTGVVVYTVFNVSFLSGLCG